MHGVAGLVRGLAHRGPLPSPFLPCVVECVRGRKKGRQLSVSDFKAYPYDPCGVSPLYRCVPLFTSLGRLPCLALDVACWRSIDPGGNALLG